jgi:hypothetical protein
VQGVVLYQDADLFTAMISSKGQICFAFVDYIILFFIFCSFDYTVDSTKPCIVMF